MSKNFKLMLKHCETYLDCGAAPHRVVGAFSRRVGGGKGIGVPSEKIKGLYSSGTLLHQNGLPWASVFVEKIWAKWALAQHGRSFCCGR